MTYLKKLLKQIFKYRNFGYKWFTFYLFPMSRYDLSIGIDTNSYPLFFISLVFISFEIEFAPLSYYNEPTEEELKHYEFLRNMSKEDKALLIAKRLLEDVEDD